MNKVYMVCDDLPKPEVIFTSKNKEVAKAFCSGFNEGKEMGAVDSVYACMDYELEDMLND